MSAANGTGVGPAGGGARREAPGELRSAELVSRLLAATPPYLYNLPLAPHSYFFSEMLRSLVHAKNGADRPAPPAQPPGHRRARKRAWNHAKISPQPDLGLKDWQQRPGDWQLKSTSADDRRNVYEEKYPELPDKHISYEKPLELTMNKNNAPKNNFKVDAYKPEENRESPDTETQSKMRKSPKVGDGLVKEDKYSHGGLLPPAAATPPGLALPPPPPPLWYPPLYPPPYGIDPLNFFIDLRVSGHIYDRKHQGKDAPPPANPGLHSSLSHREVAAPDITINPHIGPIGFESDPSAFKDGVKPGRHASAFSVPKPRDSAGSGKHFPINLCHGGSNKFNMKYFDDVDSKLHEGQGDEKNPTSTHYVMQNLKRIYGELTEGTKEEAVEREGAAEAGGELEGGDDSDSSETKKKRCKDLRALIGLELVVDYVKGRPPPAEGDSSSDVEVMGEQKSN